MQIFHSPFLKILFARKHGKSQRNFRRSGTPKPEKLRHTVNNLSNAPNNIRLFDKTRKNGLKFRCRVLRYDRDRLIRFIKEYLAKFILFDRL